jgi:hypothetical protein
MIELLATITIMASSIFLFGYWFRYSCLLIVSARTSKDYAASLVHANGLRFPEVQSSLRDNADTNLDRLRDSLDRDYALIRGLMKQFSSDSPLEERILAINYSVTGAWYRVSSQFSPRAARQALEEMSMVVAHMANSVGECAASAA